MRKDRGKEILEGMKAGSADYILNIRSYKYVPKPVHSEIILI